MIIQIYEVRRVAEAKKLADLGINNIGVLVGKGKFPRELNYKAAKEIFKALPKGVKGVALSLSEDIDEITKLASETNPDILHLGTLPELLTSEKVRALKHRLPNIKLMRAIPVVGEESVELAKEYDGIVDYLLLDTMTKNDSLIGATGKVHDWNISRKVVDAVKIPVVLAGGLGPDNVTEAILKVKPAGVDSKTKTDIQGDLGKDMGKVKEFVKAIKAAEKLL